MHAQQLFLKLNEVLDLDRAKDKELEPSYEDVCCILQTHSYTAKTYLYTSK